MYVCHMWHVRGCLVIVRSSRTCLGALPSTAIDTTDEDEGVSPPPPPPPPAFTVRTIGDRLWLHTKYY